MTSWEHHTEVVDVAKGFLRGMPSTPHEEAQRVGQRLSELGRDGWELVSHQLLAVEGDPGGPDGRHHMIVMKRPA